MNSQTKHNTISWTQFEIFNQDTRTAFEKMCRLLFNRHFFNNKALFHSNPNNPGIEVEPIFEPQRNKRISFQAKYFSTTDYSQIMHSAKQTVKYYSGELDILYFYCNNDLTITSKSYKDIEAALNAANIELKPLNNQTILDQVIVDPVIAALYFNHHGLTDDWFMEHLKISLESFGPRYNDQFNVITKTEEYINLFSKNNDAIIQINKKKSDALNEIKKTRWQYGRSHDSFIDKVFDFVKSLNDVTSENILQCLDWSTAIQETFSNEIAALSKEVENKEKIFADELDKEKRIDLEREIRKLQYLADLPLSLEFDDLEKNLLLKKALVVQGDAGVGKSQLFANASEKIIRSNGHALLLQGNSYLSNDSINFQIISHLGLSFDIDKLLNVLEGIGEQQNQCIVIFVDAINESYNKNIWKTGLNQLIKKLDKLNHVRLAISVRTGYESLVFDDAVQQKIELREVLRLFHMGFREESIEATKAFLNHYNIPFSPSYFLQYEMTNPLFLTLFCKTYSGENFDITTLFEKIINKTDKEAQKAVGLDGSSDILKYLVNAIAEHYLNNGKRAITKKELLELDFWNIYGLATNKIPFLTSIEKAGLLISSVYNGTESYFLGYNLLEDFICAKLIIEKYSDKEILKSYLQENLLEIKDGKITNYLSRDVFIVVCGLYAEKYNEDFIDIIDILNDEVDKYHIIESYIDSFLWRKSSSVDADSFIDFLNQHRVSADKVWRVFIENSIKPNHPLNANLLHTVLMKKAISDRDRLWTIYINGFADEEERLFQLIDFFDKGNSLDGLTDDNIVLMLTLFSWLLTSTNRFLRDKTSKAIIELLKVNFHLSQPLLEMFGAVNDPYVIQRLYGVVFGACMKRTRKFESEFEELSKYIFNTIFNQDLVYPDILLRDYARLILERCLYELPHICKLIDANRFRPPYRSIEIPVVEKENYYQENAHKNGFNSIEMSMHPDQIDGPGMYGDFGRYVFQAAATDFDKIDMENLYHYSMQFIRNELGYNDELFGSYDSSTRYYSYNRHDVKKTERIGKKYQWIAMYNILARISDTHFIKGWNDEPHPYEGAWEPYVRDFDPTLNCHFLLPPNLPQFDLVEQPFEFINPSKNETEIRDWTNGICGFFSSHASKLMIDDKYGQTWILLNQHEKIRNQQRVDAHSMGFVNGSQEIWSMSNGYIVKQDEFEAFRSNLKEKNFMGRWFLERRSVYQMFNREYVWSPSYQSFFDDSWLDYQIETDEKITIKHTGRIPKYNFENKEDDFLAFEEQEWEQVEIIKRTLGRVMPAHSRILWEEQYDASQREATAFDIPCKDIIDYLQLEQKEYDGYFYSKDHVLVSFDGNLANICDGLLIRKAYLDKYLNENGLRLFWTCLGEKQYFCGERNQIWSEWSGFLYLENDEVMGKMNNVKSYP